MTSDTATLADHAAHTIRQLAHHTRAAITPLTTADLYTTTGALTDLAAALAQTLGQPAAHLPTTESGAAAATQLRQARSAAHGPAALTDAAHQTLDEPAEATRNQPGGSKFNRR